MTRTALVNRLRGARSLPVVALLAPAGYGKTTLLAQWAERDERPFAWVSIAEEQGDERELMAHVEAALGRLEPLASGGDSLRAIAASWFALEQPVVLVIDGVHHLRGKACAKVVTTLAEHVPEGSTLVLAGRALPPGPLARLRASRSLFELGVDELALTRREVGLLLRGLGLELAAADISKLVDCTEGWPTGVYLAALSLKDSGGSLEAAGEDRFVADYFDFECLSHAGAKDVRLLMRTSILDSMCGPLCDAVLDDDGSARKLAALEKTGLFLVPLDHSRSWYRYHHQFRGFLRSELERREPKLVRALNRRAAIWCEAHGDVEAAIGYARAAGDTDRLARLVGAHALSAWGAGQSAAVESWVNWFDDGGRLERYPAIAAIGALIHALRGRTAEAERWLAAAESSTARRAMPDRSGSIDAWLAVLQAAMCKDGVERMLADAETALAGLAPASFWRPAALHMRGAAQILLGEYEAGDISLAEAVEAADASKGRSGLPSLIAAVAERSLLALARGDDLAFAELAERARALVDEQALGDDVRSAIAFAASARRELRRGRLEQARSDLTRAQALRNQLTVALPWYAVRTGLELAAVHLALLDVGGARAWLAHSDEILRRRPRLGNLAARRCELEAEAEDVARAQEGRASALTPAELRLLPLLATHRSFREIGEQLLVSRNTVKTQAISVYRKLGVSSRSEAIERAAGLGLLETGSTAVSDFIRLG